MKKYGLLFVLITLISCKSKSGVVMTAPKENKNTTSSVIEKLYQNKNDFSTLYIKSSANYADEKMSQNVTAEIKITNISECSFFGNYYGQSVNYSRRSKLLRKN